MPIFCGEGGGTNKLLFLHIPKTGGTSIEHEFKKRELFRVDQEYLYTPWKDFLQKSRQSGVRCSLQHLTFEEIKVLFPSLEFSGVFLIVRNPFDRLVSEYFYLKKRIWAKDRDCRLWGLSKKWCRSVLEDFNVFVRSMHEKYTEDRHFLDNHFMPQHEFIRGLEGHPISRYTRVYSFDHIRDGSILDRIETDFKEHLPWDDYPRSTKKGLVHKNRFTPERHHGIRMEPETIDLILRWFEHDFRFFGFPTEPPVVAQPESISRDPVVYEDFIVEVPLISGFSEGDVVETIDPVMLRKGVLLRKGLVVSVDSDPSQSLLPLFFVFGLDTKIRSPLALDVIRRTDEVDTVVSPAVVDMYKKMMNESQIII